MPEYLYELGRDADDVLPLPVLDQVQRLQRRDDVVLRDGRHRREVFDAQRPPVITYSVIQLSVANTDRF